MSANHGRHGRPWNRLRDEVRMRKAPCCRCGQRIDYSLRAPDPKSFTVDHYPHPLSTHPHLAHDPANLAAAHLGCNSAAGNRGATPQIGATSETW